MQYDKGVWIRYDPDGGELYEYICTYVDNLMIVFRNPHCVMDAMKYVYIIKSINLISYYLDNDYKRDKQW